MDSGPDRLTPADSYITWQRDGSVKLRMGNVSPENQDPISVPSLLIQTAQSAPDQLAMVVKRDGRNVEWTYQEYLEETRTVAKAFIKLGLERYNSVAIMGFNSPEWFISDLAAVFAGGIATGIYATNSRETCDFILKDCQANILVVEDDEQLNKVLPLKAQLPHLKAVVQYIGLPSKEGVLSWQDLIQMGQKENDDELNSRLGQQAINQCCHLVYTSGTTGLPKGVMLSHDNITYNSKVLSDTYSLKLRQERMVSYLPLSHVAANLVDIFVIQWCQSTIYFADRSALKGTLVQTLKEVCPTEFFAVPRVWEKMMEQMQRIGRKSSGLTQYISGWAKTVGYDYNVRRLSSTPQTWMDEIKYQMADKLVFQRVKQALGLDQCRWMAVAASPISQETLKYFMSLDLVVMDIYGLSECSGPQTANTGAHYKMGTIGKSLPGLRTAIHRNDEIIMQGRNVMMGYLNDQKNSEMAFTEDGWFLSGDLGKQDPEGFFNISGRLKELIVTAGGENIPTALIENVVKSELPCVNYATLIGDGRKFLSCLLTMKCQVDPATLEVTSSLDPAAVEWCSVLGVQADTLEQVLGQSVMNEAVRKGLQDGIDRANERAISHAQRIQKWLLLPNDFSVPSGELGPTLKVKRHFVLKKYSQQIEQLYSCN